MANAVYTLTLQALTGSVSERAAHTMLQASLQERGLNAEQVTASQMQEILYGPLMVRLSSVLPPARAHTELLNMSRQLEAQSPKSPTLFTDAGSFAAWDETLITAPVSAPDLTADDFEFDDPEFGGGLSERAFDLGSDRGQEELIQHLGKMQGVQGVLVSRSTGQVLKVKAMRESGGLSAVIAATAMLFQKRNLKLMSADLGGQTVCMRPLGGYCVAVIAGPQVNIGRLLAELQQLGELA